MDPLARKISLGFPGGSVTATRGLLQAVFGTDLVNAQQFGEATVSVQGHSRVRVIGGASTPVAAHSFTKKKYPTGQRGGGSGGEAIQVLVDGDWWTMRLTGSHQEFNDWLASNPGNNTAAIQWRSEKGTPYGPFKAA